MTNVEDALAQLRKIVLREGNTLRNREALARAKEELRAELATTTPAPAPEPAPTPAPAPFFDGTRLAAWNQRLGNPAAMTEVTLDGRQAIKMTVLDSDGERFGPTKDPRAQLSTPHLLTLGKEFFWGGYFYLPSSTFGPGIPGWLNLWEMFGEPFDESPPFELQVYKNVLRYNRNRTYGWDVPWQAPLTGFLDRWVRVDAHLKVGDKTSGFVELSIDRKLVLPKLQMATWDASNSGQPNVAIIQSYRQKGILPSATVYFAETKLGDTLASVGG
jgi:Polysaccharide lyase